nr:MAG TPA: hypothetical protein [Caudoviricetes sp.]
MRSSRTAICFHIVQTISSLYNTGLALPLS